MAISLQKLQDQAPQLVDLRKSVDAKMHGNPVMEGHAAKVALALDYSGSMAALYRSGAVQKLAERVLALATAFDDDGDIDVFIFATKAHYVGALGIGNYQNGVDRLLLKYRMGSTNYADAIRVIRAHYYKDAGGFFGKLLGKKRLPVYVMVITDGEPDSRPDAEQQIREASKDPIFWQFMGLGKNRFDFLSRLDELSGRFIDNAGFFAVDNPESMPNHDLYQSMLAQYPTWVADMQARHII